MCIRRIPRVLPALLAALVWTFGPAAVVRAAEDEQQRPTQTGRPGSAYEPDPGNYVDEPTQHMGKEAPATDPRPVPELSDTERRANEAGLKRILSRLPKGTRHQFVMMPLRDGTRLATDIFLPPQGDGPWPVVLLRTPYHRWNDGGYSSMRGTDCAMVLQNVRGQHGSEAGKFDPYSFDSEINDGYDTIEWIARQKWCNGKVGMYGASGNGMAACNALWSLAPHLTMIDVNITGDNAYLHWTFSNGARRFLYSWFQQRGVRTRREEWPRPTTMAYDAKAYYDFIKKRGPEVRSFYRMKAGWFDVFSEAALDAFAVLAPSGRAYLNIAPIGHGPIGGDVKFQPRNAYPREGLRVARAITLKNVLTQEAPAAPGSCLMYYLMGDPRDPEAPGNIYMISDKWPVDHTPTAYYLRQDGTLTLDAPAEQEASRSYQYDPRDPVRSVGGHYDVTDPKRMQIGPLDQRVLAERKDILRFATEPLAAPVGITGKVWLELHVSSDAPDTMFTMKLVDVYPDGYEAVIRESAMLARCWQGLDKLAPIEKGKVYKLSMDCWSTALVFNKGHRIAVHISSSSDPAYEVHPNTCEPVASIAEARVARNTVHMSAAHASKLILPVVAPETYLNAGRPDRP